MSDTIREQIIAAIVAKLAGITTANGYNTDIGRFVRRVRHFENDDRPGISVIPRPEEASKIHGKARMVMPVAVEGNMKFGDENPSVTAEKILGDLRTLMEAQAAADDPTGGLADFIEYTAGGTDEYPEPGHFRVGCYAVYNITYKTLAGDPYRQTPSSSSSSSSQSSSSSSSSS